MILPISRRARAEWSPAPAAVPATDEEKTAGERSRDDVAVYQGGALRRCSTGCPPTPCRSSTSLSGCAVADIHLSCGWFSSARLVNPSAFHQMGFEGCQIYHFKNSFQIYENKVICSTNILQLPQCSNFPLKNSKMEKLAGGRRHSANRRSLVR